MSPAPPSEPPDDDPDRDVDPTDSSPAQAATRSSFDADDVDDVRAGFARFAQTTADVAPTYARLSRAVADDLDIARVAHIVLAAPRTQRNPVLLFAAVHWLLLRGSAHPLGAHYPTIATTAAPGDLVADFTDFVAHHRDELTAVVAERATQTNEVGRGAALLPVLVAIADRAGPLAWVDLGTSAGLNLSMDRWTYRWTRDTHEVVALPGHPNVVVTSDVIGPLPLPTSLPSIPWRLGVDRAPLDVTSDDDATWLLACTWPDEPVRFERLRAALEVARTDPPTIRTADLVDDLADVVASVPADLHLVLTTSWVLNYLPSDRQTAFIDAVDSLGRNRDLDVVVMESPQVTPGLDLDTPDRVAAATVLTRLRWRDGNRSVDHLATVQSHAWWIDATLERL